MDRSFRRNPAADAGVVPLKSHKLTAGTADLIRVMMNGRRRIQHHFVGAAEMIEMALNRDELNAYGISDVDGGSIKLCQAHQYIWLIIMSL
jgi:hypothetical protein